MLMPSSSEWWTKADLQQRHKVKCQTPWVLVPALPQTRLCRRRRLCSHPHHPVPQFPQPKQEDKRGDEVHPYPPTKIWWRHVRGKSMLLMNYPGISGSPSKSPTGSKVSKRDPAQLSTGLMLSRGLVLRRGMTEAAESHLEG